MEAVQGELIQAGAGFATAQVITLTDVDQNEKKAFFLTVVAGTVKIGKGEVIAAAHGWAAGDTVPAISCFNGELYFTAAASTDTFVLTAV